MKGFTDWNRPPAGISIPDFFQTWLPAAFEASGRRAPPNAPVVRATFSGEGGGSWDVQCDDTQLLVEAASPSASASALRASVPAGARAAAPLPDVWLRQAAADFKAAFDGDPNLPELLPPGWSALDLLFLDPRDVELLAQVSGRVVVEVTGSRARRWAFDVAFGKAGVTAGRARTTIRLDGTTFAGLQNGSIPPMQALLGGGLIMEGDRALAMQLLLLFGSRLNRR